VRRRALGIVMLLGGLLLVGRLWHRAPVDVEVSFRPGPQASQLRGLEARYLREDGLEVRRVHFNYDVGGAPAEQVHHTRLAPGHYRVLIRLQPVGAPERSLERRLELTGGSGEHAYLDLQGPS
jgi:hypothetical protein